MSSGEREKIVPINIEDEMKTAYIDYSMSVIVSRALPDVRDGLKPVHRRVLYGMTELGLAANRPYKKSARIVGEVLGKYHPHGDSSVYDTMVRLAQDWNMRYPMVDGQGNFGSIDGDPPAAMRYTEARLRKIAEEMMVDIEKDTVDFRPNFDDSLSEPTVMPSKVPNLLINGAAGIAVGMATNMAPHNITEAINATIAYIDNREITVQELMQYIKAPDFPTGGTIYGYEGVKDAFETGRGRVVLRGKAAFETSKSGKEQIVVTEIPYQVNKSSLVQKIAELVNEKVVDGISEIRDESDREGMRIVFDLKRDAVPNVVLNQLYKFSMLQTSFSVNNVALVNGRPLTLNLRELIHYFVEHRHEVVVRRTKFELEEAKKRAHILEGLIIALDNLDEVIGLIRNSRTPDEARNGLMERFGLTEIQSKAILDMRLQRLTGLEIDKIKEEYAEIMKEIDYLNSILADEALRMKIIKDELTEMREKYGDERRTDIIYAGDDFRIEDMIPDETVAVTISHMGYIKRTPISEYKAQSRGGKGSRGVAHRDEDFVEHLLIATTHNYMLFFTEQGRCFWLRVFEIPEGNKTSKGRAIQNLINIPADDKIRAFVNAKTLQDEEYINNHFIIMCTKKGVIKKTSLEAYSRPRANGINAITVREGDQLLEAKLTNGFSEVIMAKKSGKAIRFNEQLIRAMGRTASGVRGVRLESATDEVIGMICVNDKGKNILVVSQKGYGKRSEIDEYRITGRGGKGVKALNVTDKTGQLIAILDVMDGEDLMIINKSGLTIRTSISELRVMGRVTQGVRLIHLKGDDEIASIAKVDEDKEVDDEMVNEALRAEESKGDFSAPVAALPEGDEDAEDTDEEADEDSNEEENEA